ncbi:MAG: F0F1 ATP synthase subunit B [Chlamydiales bacterium]|nr:F0F1 ATP synthase subunit B [Chlamydiales bacterium]
MNLELGQILTQSIAFLIMFAILRRYAWGPLMRLMDERRETIQSGLDSIEEQKKEIQNLVDDYQSKVNAIESEANAKMADAVRKGQALAQEIQEAAHNDAKNIINKAQGEIVREVQKAKNQLKDEVVNMAIEVAQKVIHEELDDPKQKKLVSDFVEQAKFK